MKGKQIMETDLKVERIGGDYHSEEEQGMCFRIVNTAAKDPKEHVIAILPHKPMFEDCELLAHTMAASVKLRQCVLDLLNMHSENGIDLEKCEQALLSALGAGENEVLAIQSDYYCSKCTHMWSETWDCACDTECGCGQKNITPYAHRYILETIKEEK